MHEEQVTNTICIQVIWNYSRKHTRPWKWAVVLRMISCFCILMFVKSYSVLFIHFVICASACLQNKQVTKLNSISKLTSLFNIWKTSFFDLGWETGSPIYERNVLRTLILGFIAVKNLLAIHPSNPFCECPTRPAECYGTQQVIRACYITFLWISRRNPKKQIGPASQIQILANKQPYCSLIVDQVAPTHLRWQSQFT